MKVLVTGFTPFGGETVNPSYEAVKLLPDEIAGNTLVKALLTTRFGASRTELQDLLNTVKPDAVVCVGQASGRASVSIEKVALNYAVAGDYDPDNVIKNNTVSESGKAAYFSTLPVENIVKALNAAGIPCVLSLTAGAFVCNYVMYSLLELTQGTGILCGFVHIPYMPSQSAAKNPPPPSMELSASANALAEIIRNLGL